MQLIRFSLHQLPLEKPEDGLEGEKDWNANRKEKRNVDCIFLVLREVEKCQQRLVKEGIFSQLKSML